MKKIIQFSMFLAFLTLFSANVFAVSYNIRVSGTQVTDENKDSIADVVPSVSKGVITYDPENNVLTLDNAYISVTSKTIILQVGIPDLTINLIGENTFVTRYYETLKVNANTTITGSGSLTLNAPNSTALWHAGGNNLTIDNTTVICNGGSGYNGNNNSNANLVINNSTFRAKGSDINFGSISRIKSLTLNGCTIAQPTGAEFVDSQNAVCLNGAPVVGQEIIIVPTYDLWVAGVQVTDVNKNNITAAVVAAEGQNATGRITYDPTSKTLTLDNAKITAIGILVCGIRNGITGLTINLVGTNTITVSDNGTYSYAGIYSFLSDFKITGSGSLTFDRGATIIILTQCNLTIENTTITLGADSRGISGFDGTEVLTIINSTVRATSTRYGFMNGIKNLILDGCAITQPSGAAFDASKKSVCLNGEIVKTEVMIEPALITYDLEVAGVQVNTTNKNDILGDGKVSYDITTNTLTLDNANVEAYGIDNSIANLTINLVGENTITTEYDGIISEGADFRIIGDGSLTINADCGIYANECNLTIENTTVTAIGGWGGIVGDFGDTEVITITNSTVKATGADWGSIADIKNLVLNGCEITQPAGAEFDEEQCAVCLSGNIVTSEVVIAPAHDLYVAGVQVTVANKNDITAAVVAAAGQTASGTISYDPTNNTLTLENASINATARDGIKNYIPNLIINLVGENSIAAINSGITSTKNMTITGTGSLIINNAYYGIYHDDCNLTIENTTVTAIGSYSGICAYDDEVLTVTNSTVKAKGTYWGSIIYINNLILNGCEITQPAGAAFDVSKKAVCLNGEIVKTEVVIEPIGDGIENVESNTQIFARDGRIFGAENARIYDILGRDVTRWNGNLQGVYIVKTEKTATKIVVR